MRKLEEILNKSIDKSNDSVKLARESIEYMAKDDFCRKKKLKLALSKILINLPKSTNL